MGAFTSGCSVLQNARLRATLTPDGQGFSEFLVFLEQFVSTLRLVEAVCRLSRTFYGLLVCFLQCLLENERGAQKEHGRLNDGGVRLLSG